MSDTERVRSIYETPYAAGAAFKHEQASLLRSVRHSGASFVSELAGEIGISMALAPSCTVRQRENGRTTDVAPGVGHLAILAPGRPLAVSMRGDFRALQLRLPLPLVAEWLAEDHDLGASALEFAAHHFGYDPALARLLYTAKAVGPEAETGILREVVARLLRIWSVRAATRGPAPPRHGGLAPAALRRVKDRVEAGLDRPLTLETLAAEAGLSPFHFAREFKRAVGRAPYQYVLDRRVARAVALLARPELSVAEVAEAAGFTHASHLARWMRGATGVSPSRFRRSVLP